jgi:glutathione synthase
VAYKFLFVMDPLWEIIPDKDTTFVFMLEAQSRGHHLFYAGLGDLFARGHQACAFARRCEVERATPHWRLLGEGQDYPLEAFHAIFMRKDPPVDPTYAYAAMMLELADIRRTFVVNRPASLLVANEKLYQLNFPEVIPPTLVTSSIARLRKFLVEQGGQMIVKPLGGHGGESVFVVNTSDRNLGAILETVTRFGSEPCMAQRYLPEARSGDKRVIVLAGEPIGATLRVPREDEHRGNIHVGATTVKAPITARDREICRIMRPRLERDGLYFVGLDIIGGYLTEVNVTSPTGVQEIDRLDGVKLEAKVIDFIESRVKVLRS